MRLRPSTSRRDARMRRLPSHSAIAQPENGAKPSDGKPHRASESQADADHSATEQGGCDSERLGQEACPARRCSLVWRGDTAVRHDCQGTSGPGTAAPAPIPPADADAAEPGPEEPPPGKATPTPRRLSAAAAFRTTNTLGAPAASRPPSITSPSAWMPAPMFRPVSESMLTWSRVIQTVLRLDLVPHSIRI